MALEGLTMNVNLLDKGIVRSKFHHSAALLRIRYTVKAGVLCLEPAIRVGDLDVFPSARIMQQLKLVAA
jgi:hypothetical protein